MTVHTRVVIGSGAHRDGRLGALSVIVVLVTSALALLGIIGWQDGGPLGWLAAAGLNSALLIWCLAAARRATVDHLALMAGTFVLVAFCFIPLVLRLLAVATTGDIGTWQTGYVSGGASDPVSVAARGQLSLGLAVVTGAFVSCSLLQPDSARPVERAPFGWRRAAPVIGGCFGVSSVALLAVAQSVNFSLSELFIALAARQDLWSGQTYLLYLLPAYKIAVMVAVGASIAGGRRIGIGLVLLLWWPTLLFDFVTGSRLDLLLRNFVPLAVILVLLGRTRFTKALIVIAILAIGLTAFVGLRATVRDYQPPSRTFTSDSLAFDPVGDVLDSLSNDEVGWLDSFRMVYGGIADSDIQPRGLSGAITPLTSVVPSALWADKPQRGGEYATENLRPLLYDRRGNIAIGGFADGYLDGRSFGLVACAVLIGVFAALSVLVIPRWLAGRSGLPQLGLIASVYGATCASPLLRSDMSEFGVSVLRWVTFLLVTYALLKGARREAAD